MFFEEQQIKDSLYLLFFKFSNSVKIYCRQIVIFRQQEDHPNFLSQCFAYGQTKYQKEYTHEIINPSEG
jgi:hypothetical protein